MHNTCTVKWYLSQEASTRNSCNCKPRCRLYAKITPPPKKSFQVLDIPSPSINVIANGRKTGHMKTIILIWLQVTRRSALNGSGISNHYEAWLVAKWSPSKMIECNFIGKNLTRLSYCLPAMLLDRARQSGWEPQKQHTGRLKTQACCFPSSSQLGMFIQSSKWA